MKVCIIGDGLVSLTLANVLVKKEILVDILVNQKSSKYDKTRTLGISKSNIDYFNNEVVEIKKILWPINNIKIFTEKNSNNEILNFKDKKAEIFSIVKNYELKKLLFKKIKKNKFIKFKSDKNFQNFHNSQYNLIINCNPKNKITKKFFSVRMEKNYESYAYTTIINHRKIVNNNTAYQNFTKNGPIAYLPISETQTSVVYSMRSKMKKNNSDIKKLIRKFNPIYSIKKIYDCSSMELKSSNLRKYYRNNILAFGDLIHKIHPLAGQGFNMSLRDIQLLSTIIDKKINLGLDIGSSTCYEFQKKSKDKNYLFSTGIDYIYEIFKFESKINSNFLSKSINLVGKNKIINSLFKKIADFGFRA